MEPRSAREPPHGPAWALDGIPLWEVLVGPPLVRSRFRQEPTGVPGRPGSRLDGAAAAIFHAIEAERLTALGTEGANLLSARGLRGALPIIASP